MHVFRRGGRLADRYLHPVLQAVEAVDDQLFPRFYACRRRRVSIRRRHVDIAGLYSIVCINDVDISKVVVALNSGRGNQINMVQRLNQQTRVHKFVGK